MHAATVTAARSRSDPLWIIGPWQDLVFLVGTPILLLLGLSLARVHWGWASIATFALIWSIGHHLPGMLRAYADPLLFQRFPFRLVLAPLFLLSIATASFVWTLNGLFLVTIVWVFNGNRVRNDPHLGGLTGFLFRPQLPLVGLYLVLIIAYGSLDYGVSTLPRGTVQNVLLGVFLASTLLHYYLDGFIWKLRESSNQATLDVHDTGYRPLIAMPQWLRHGCYWGLLLVPLIGLSASQLLRPAAGLDQARQLAEITPRSVKAQVRVAQRGRTAAPRTWRLSTTSAPSICSPTSRLCRTSSPTC